MIESFVHTASAGRVVFGAGMRHGIAAEADRLGISRCFLICGGSARQAGTEFVESAAALGIEVGVWWTEVVQHVPLALAEAACSAARDAEVNGLVCIGGGSAVGLAKAIVLRHRLPFVAAPTTYAGSEQTAIYGITDRHRKVTGRDDAVRPDTVVYDPELTVGLPMRVGAASAFNALAHSVESLWVTGANPLTKLAALEGVRAIRSGLPTVLRNSRDLSGRSELLYGAFLSGLALGATTTGLHHKICHVLGGTFDLVHADAHAVVLPHVVAFNEQVLPVDMERLSSALGTSDRPSAALFDLAATTGMPTSLEQLGLRRADLTEVVVRVFEELPANPRPVTAEDLTNLLQAAFDGRRPEANLYDASTKMNDPTPVLDHQVLTHTTTIASRAAPSTSSQAAEVLLNDVIGRLEHSPNARLRDITEAAVRHLHAFAAEVRLQRDEWGVGIEFLTATGKMCDAVRQEFILLSDSLGVSSLVELLTHDAGQGTTDNTVLGPFYVPGSPERAEGDSMLVDADEGQPVVLRGTVRNGAGRPIGGASLDVWQNASSGFYACQQPLDQSPGNLRGLYRSDPEGFYEIRTIRPVPYPIPDDGPAGTLLKANGRGWWRPGHVHLWVRADGYKELITHVFDAESPFLDSDAVFGVRRSLVRAFVPDAAGELEARFDIILDDADDHAGGART